MHDDVIAHMRARIGQIRKVISLAHDQRMIETLEKVIADIEADIVRLEADKGADAPVQEVPLPKQH